MVSTGWKEPAKGHKTRVYIAQDNSELDDFEAGVSRKVYEELDKSPVGRVNLGIHLYDGKLYSSNLVGVCRLKNIYGDNIKDEAGNELVLKIIPRFNIDVVEILNYISRYDDEFDRYLAPQTVSNHHNDKEIESVDRNEIFYFFENEKPLKVEDDISRESSIISVTIFLNLLKALCKRPLMGRMIRHDENLTAKVKGKIVIEKNIRVNTMHGRSDRFYCRYLHYTDNIPENQALKAALLKSKRFITSYFGTTVNNRNIYTEVLSYCTNALKHIDDVTYTGDDCRKFRFSGYYVYYNKIMSLASMILDEISLESNGIVNTSGLVIPYAVSMEKLFEVYVRAYLKHNGILSYKSTATSGIQMEKFDDKIDVFEDSPSDNSGKYIAGPIKPDIILRNITTGETAVYDVKYKDYRKNSRNDRLQLLAYGLMLNANNIGIILPAISEDRIFDSREVNSQEERLIKYHQILLKMQNKNDVEDNQPANYIRNHIVDNDNTGNGDDLS